MEHLTHSELKNHNHNYIDNIIYRFFNPHGLVLHLSEISPRHFLDLCTAHIRWLKRRLTGLHPHQFCNPRLIQNVLNIQVLDIVQRCHMRLQSKHYLRNA